jgi:hypothetical protein
MRWSPWIVLLFVGLSAVFFYGLPVDGAPVTSTQLNLEAIEKGANPVRIALSIGAVPFPTPSLAPRNTIHGGCRAGEVRSSRQ